MVGSGTPAGDREALAGVLAARLTDACARSSALSDAAAAARASVFAALAAFGGLSALADAAGPDALLPGA